MQKKKFVVTPWEVSGEIDYEKLIEEFGVEPITDKLLKRIKKHTKELHMFLRRKFFFSHRDFNHVLDSYERGQKFVLYTGRGPSGHTHLGHIIPWIFTKHLQDVFDAKLYFQMTDDEKFLIKPELTLEQTIGFTYDNALDVIALGFDPKKTKIFSNIEYAKTQYKMALQIAKHIPFSTAKAVFGFNSTSNIGIIFFPAMQAVPAFMAQLFEGQNERCLIPCAVDQEPYWRVARDVAPKLGLHKPAGIYCKFLPGLGQGGKMSASLPETCVYTTDSLEYAKKKVWNAFTGGRATVKEQREKGGIPEICSVYHWLYILFEKDDGKIKEIYRKCKNGEILCGEDKEILANYVNKFLSEHQRKREKAKDLLEKFMVRD
ncbi:MAG: tryptophan--tRNA ligase [Euryarchaeota archaeon]|nr:tryptophan--tRNA ligase [Euryarchaeota archaeon]